MSSKPLDPNAVVIEGISDLYEVLAIAWIKQNKTKQNTISCNTRRLSVKRKQKTYAAWDDWS